MPIASELLEILACPKCKGDISLTPQADGLTCAKCAVVYPIREDIPIMLIEEAVELARWEKGERQAKP
ncbi:MAG: Trm112 family protein [Desulfovibrio sp.]|nr:Trm112 family protein [Desulfovibrio sp.]MBI4959709.1 Trm112 family protein [Desulfovibrio sp.]